MKKSSLRDTLPLGFVDQQLKQGPLENIEDFSNRIQSHLIQQLSEIEQAALKEELPVIRPLAKSIQMGLNVLNDHSQDELLIRIQSLCGKMRSIHEVEECIQKLLEQTKALRQ